MIEASEIGFRNRLICGFCLYRASFQKCRTHYVTGIWDFSTAALKPQYNFLLELSTLNLNLIPFSSQVGSLRRAQWTSCPVCSCFKSSLIATPQSA